jgi:hypothetical protein
MPTPTKVKGIKFGTWAQYKAISPKDPDTLYFITDKGGTIYRGQSLVIPQRVIENVTTANDIGSIGGVTLGRNQTMHTFTLEAFQTASGGTQADPVSLTFSVYTKDAVDAVISVLNSTLTTHRAVSGSGTVQDPYIFADGKATNAVFGHTRLTDTVDGKNLPAAASGGMAVTPKGVYDYVQSVIGGIGGGIVFKGTIGNAPAYDSTATYAVGDYCTYSFKLYKCTTAITTAEQWTAAHWTEIGCTVSSLPTPADGYEAGWEYVVVAPGIYAGKKCEVDDRIMSINNSSGSGSSVVDADWTVSQANISGAVTAGSDLDNNTVVLGNGGTAVKKLSNGTAGQWLRIVNGVPTWVNHPNTDHGIAYGVCDMDWSISDVIVFEAYQEEDVFLQNYSLLCIFFEQDATPQTQMRIKIGANGTPYFVTYRASAIPSDIIKEGDTGLFMFDGDEWNLIAVDKRISDVGTSGDYDDLSHKPILYITDGNAANASSPRTITSGVDDFTEGQKRVVCVKYTYGISSASPTMKLGTNGTAHPIYWHGAAYNGGATGISPIGAGDIVTYIFDGTYFNIISVDRKIDSVPTSGSTGFITSGGVYTAIQNAIDAAALWWEEMPAVSHA